MQRHTHRSILALAVATGLLGIGSNLRAETLEEALYKVSQTNPQIRAQQALVRATDELAPQALYNWRPTITATAETGWDRKNDNTATTSDARTKSLNPKAAKITINEYLFRGGRTIAATSVAENKILAERSRLMVTESGVLTDSATAYLRVLLQRELVNLTRTSELGIADELAGTRRRFDMGERTRTDISQAETRHAKAVGDRVSAESDLAVAEAMYRGLMGFDPGNLNAPALPDALPAKRETAIALALESNYGIAAALYDEKAARHNVKLVKGELLPTLALQGTLSRDWESSTNESRIDDAALKLMLTVPIFDGGLAYSKTRQARQLVSQSSNTLEKARRDAAEAASKTWDSMMLAKERIRVSQARVAAADTALANVSREQSFGTRSLIDVLDARQDLVDSKTALVRAKFDLMVAAFQLKQSIGEMTAVKLNLGEPDYNPVPHYEEVHDKWFGTRSSGDKERGAEVPVFADPPPRELAPLPADIKAASPLSLEAPARQTPVPAPVVPPVAPAPASPAPMSLEPAPVPEMTPQAPNTSAVPLAPKAPPSGFTMESFAPVQSEALPAPVAPPAAAVTEPLPQPVKPEAAPKAEPQPQQAPTKVETILRVPAKPPATAFKETPTGFLAQLGNE
ncbi:MAG: hypothetical protein EPN26_02725 [Rhodospirillales bacterium]|nr:MAG: hypothetical protein EPN26_02725 [Rhodospirillales bacterium]